VPSAFVGLELHHHEVRLPVEAKQVDRALAVDPAAELPGETQPALLWALNVLLEKSPKVGALLPTGSCETRLAHRMQAVGARLERRHDVPVGALSAHRGTT
jgi:hypothetical protein